VQRGRPRQRGNIPAVIVTFDTGWVIAAEKNPSAARRHIAALTQLNQIAVIIPPVHVEGLFRAKNPTATRVAIAKIKEEAVLPEDGHRAADLLRAAGAQSSDAHKRIHEIGTNDALVAAVAERVGGIVYTSDPKHMKWLQEAGARITVMPVPF
jgi:predicted nucleic acid-binding protein